MNMLKNIILLVYYSELTLHKCQYNFTNKNYLHTDALVFKVSDDGFMAYGLWF